MKTINQLMADRAKIIGDKNILSKTDTAKVRLIDSLIQYLNCNVAESDVKAQLTRVERELDFLGIRFCEFKLPKGVDERLRKPTFEKMYGLPKLRQQRRTLKYLLSK